MYNNGRLYGNYYEGFSYSPDRSRDIDRFNTSTKSQYSFFDPSKQYTKKAQDEYFNACGVYEEIELKPTNSFFGF